MTTMQSAAEMYALRAFELLDPADQLNVAMTERLVHDWAIRDGWSGAALKVAVEFAAGLADSKSTVDTRTERDVTALSMLTTQNGMG